MREGVIQSVSSAFLAELQPIPDFTPDFQHLFPNILHTLNNPRLCFTLSSANFSKGGETVVENKNAAASTKVAADKTAAMNGTAAVNRSDAVDKAAAEDATPAYHGMAPAVAHCGKPYHPANLTTTVGASA